MPLTQAHQFLVENVEMLNESTFIVRTQKKDFHFQPGQYCIMGPKDQYETREYSIYSSPHDPFLEILVRLVEKGRVTPCLQRLKKGQTVYIQGPFGFFLLPKEPLKHHYWFIATGTGISPFHSFIQTYPHLNYQLLHGIPYAHDQYQSHLYKNYTPCISREKTEHFHGRVIQWVNQYIQNNPPPSDLLCYLCGNCDMIYQMFDILLHWGIPSENIFSEVYF